MVCAKQIFFFSFERERDKICINSATRGCHLCRKDNFMKFPKERMTCQKGAYHLELLIFETNKIRYDNELLLHFYLQSFVYLLITYLIPMRFKPESQGLLPCEHHKRRCLWICYLIGMSSTWW